MSETMWAVVAEEDDYYPATVTIGVFPTKEAAEAYAAEQPKRVQTVIAGARLPLKQDFTYEVVEIPVSPTKPWKEAAP